MSDHDSKGKDLTPPTKSRNSTASDDNSHSSRKMNHDKRQSVSKSIFRSFAGGVFGDKKRDDDSNSYSPVIGSPMTDPDEIRGTANTGPPPSMPPPEPPSSIASAPSTDATNRLRHSGSSQSSFYSPAAAAAASSVSSVGPSASTPISPGTPSVLVSAPSPSPSPSAGHVGAPVSGSNSSIGGSSAAPSGSAIVSGLTAPVPLPASSSDVQFQVTFSGPKKTTQVLPENDTVPKAWRERYKVINEILGTETDYVRDLELIIDEFVNPLKKAQPPLLPADKQAMIFSNISILINVNRELMQALYKAVTLVVFPPDNHAADAVDPVLLGPCFSSFADYLKMYSQYCTNQQVAFDTLAECQKKFPLFRAFLEEKQMEPCKGQPLTGYLIKPIQRICKYPLLLRELTKNTSDSHPDSVPLAAAADKIDVVVAHVNESKRRTESHQKIFEVQSRFEQTESLNLLLHSRRFVREGQVREMLSVTEIRDIYFFLFNDMLLIAQPSSKKLTQEAQLMLAQCTLIDLDDNVTDAKLKNAFEIRKDRQEMIYFCSDPHTKQLWMTDIAAAMRGERDMDSEAKQLQANKRGPPPKIPPKPKLHESPSTTALTFEELAKSRAAPAVPPKKKAERESSPSEPPRSARNKKLPAAPGSTGSVSSDTLPLPDSPKTSARGETHHRSVSSTSATGSDKERDRSQDKERSRDDKERSRDDKERERRDRDKDRPERADRPERTERDRSDRDRADRPERTERDRSDRDRSDRDRVPREKSDRERSDKPGSLRGADRPARSRDDAQVKPAIKTDDIF